MTSTAGVLAGRSCSVFRRGIQTLSYKHTRSQMPVHTHTRMHTFVHSQSSCCRHPLGTTIAWSTIADGLVNTHTHALYSHSLAHTHTLNRNDPQLYVSSDIHLCGQGDLRESCLRKPRHKLAPNFTLCCRRRRGMKMSVGGAVSRCIHQGAEASLLLQPIRCNVHKPVFALVVTACVKRIDTPAGTIRRNVRTINMPIVAWNPIRTKDAKMLCSQSLLVSWFLFDKSQVSLPNQGTGHVSAMKDGSAQAFMIFYTGVTRAVRKMYHQEGMSSCAYYHRTLNSNTLGL